MKKGDIYRPDRMAVSSKTIRDQDEASELYGQSEQVNGVVQDGSRKSSRGSRENRMKENTDPASNILVSQKPLTPKPSKSPIQGWSENDKEKKEPTDPELMSTHKDTALHEEGLEIQSVSARETTENSKDGSHNGETKNNDVHKEANNGVGKNDDIHKNNKLDVNGENTDAIEEEKCEVRTENPIFVTEGAEEGDRSVQDGRNAENKDETSESEQMKKVVDKVDQNGTD